MAAIFMLAEIVSFSHCNSMILQIALAVQFCLKRLQKNQTGVILNFHYLFGLKFEVKWDLGKG